MPDLRIRVVNVVDLMTLQPQSEHPHGLADEEFDADLHRRTGRSIFAFHGYPWVIHRLTYRRHNHDNIHVRGYKEEGTTTTPFDMCVLNNIDRFQLTLDAITRVPRLARKVEDARQWYSEQIQRHKLYVAENGEDLPEIREWQWDGLASVFAAAMRRHSPSCLSVSLSPMSGCNVQHRARGLIDVFFACFGFE